MDSGDSFQLIILIILLVLSAFFSSSETALMSVNKIRLCSLAESGNKRAALALDIVENKTSKMLSAILIGNNIVNLSASAIATSLAYSFGGYMVSIATAILTVAILVFGEITPKNFATIHAEKISLAYIPIIRFFMFIMTPIIFLIDLFSRGFMFLLRVDPNARNNAMTEDELRTIVDVSHEDGVIESEEKEMIYNVFDLGDVKAKEVMVPRQDMVAIDIDEPVDSYLDDILQSMHSKIPVYQEDIDNIIGILSTKALTIEARKKSFENLDIRSLLTPAYFVPENRRTDALFREMQQKKEKLAILIDEYGGVSGMVTLEDLIEVIVGDIHEEYEEVEPEIIELEPGHVYSLSGSIALSDLKEEFHLDMDSVCDTLSGYLMEVLGYIPTEKALPLTVTTPEADYEILKMEDRVIDRVKMTLKEAQTSETGDAT